MQNYAIEGCKTLVSELKNKCSMLYYQIEENKYKNKVDEKVINDYLEARQDYLFAKEKLEKMESKI